MAKEATRRNTAKRSQTPPSVGTPSAINMRNGITGIADQKIPVNRNQTQSRLFAPRYSEARKIKECKFVLIKFSCRCILFS